MIDQEAKKREALDALIGLATSMIADAEKALNAVKAELGRTQNEGGWYRGYLDGKEVGISSEISALRLITDMAIRLKEAE